VGLIDDVAAGGTRTGADQRPGTDGQRRDGTHQGARAGTDRGTGDDALLGVVHARTSGQQKHRDQAQGQCNGLHLSTPFVALMISVRVGSTDRDNGQCRAYRREPRRPPVAKL
jgi:hypothetical protein